MKSVPNLISYLHKFFWNFSQFLAIYFELFSSGGKFKFRNRWHEGPTCQPPLPALGPPVSVPSPRGCHAPAPRRTHALKALSGPRRLACRTLTAPPPTASPRVPPTAVVCSWSRVSERTAAVYPVRCTGEYAASSRSRALLAALTLSTFVIVGRRWTAVPPARRRLRHELGHTVVRVPVRPRRAFPCTASRAPMTSSPRGTRVAPPRARAQRRTVAGHAGRSRPGKAVGRVSCVNGPRRHCGCGPRVTVQMGRARIRQINFSIFRIYSIPCKFKNLCRILLNSENYETNFVE
jgi:hypothetical protein